MLFRKTNRRADRSTYNRTPAIEVLETRTLLSAATTVTPDLVVTPLASTSTFTGYTPAQIKAAYGFNAVSGDGTGQTIAIVDAYDDPNIAADLKAFDAKYGLADTTLTKVSQTGGSTKSVAASADWAGEIALDVEWAHAIAPGAKIVLVEANSDSITDLMSAVDTARRISGVSVVSMSWGTSEFTGDTYYDKYFTTPKGHTPVTFVAASGDEGSWYGPDFPATSSYVLAVGGTTLNLTSSGTYAGETAWSDSTGGVSSIESEPSYQASVQTTGARSSPDVSYDANPNTGFAVYDSYGSGGWTVVGGTSAGAPQWASLIALADQARATKGLAALDGATGTLPALYKLYASPTSSSYATYTADFHDVTSGRSSAFYSATAGYDAVTGLGSPVASSVVTALTAATTTPLTTVAVSRSRARAAARSLQAAFVTNATEDAIETTVTPNRPTITYSLGRKSASDVVNALTVANQPTSSSDEAGTVVTTETFASVRKTTTPTADFAGLSMSDSAPIEFASSFRSTWLANEQGVSLEEPSMDGPAFFADDTLQFSHAATDLVPTATLGAVTTSPMVAALATAGALAAEAIVVGHWYGRRAASKRKGDRAASPFAVEPIRRDE